MKISDLIPTPLKIDVTGITEKASEVKPGDIFCAVKGTKVNGADFVEQAVKQGAVAILTDQDIHTSIPVIKDQAPRQTLTQISAKLYPSDNLKKVAVTGTNGKTSTVYFVAQIMNALRMPTASMGTIGVASPLYNEAGKMTTPDAVTLNKTFHTLQTKGIQLVAMEASSHGLHQGRLDGHLMKAAAFTNLTRDHLDYHHTMEEYLQAKMRLFTDYLESNGTAVLNADIPEFEALNKLCVEKGHKVISYGKRAETLKIINQTPTINGQNLTLSVDGQSFDISLKIYGDFQAYNILAAVGLCLGLGKTWTEIAKILPTLTAPTGRLDLVGTTPNGAQIFVDYAHTPDALERVLISLRQHTQNKLACLFGCGGNRDTGKRPQMGEIANRLSDIVYISDDNPRNEAPELIRQQIKDACPKGQEITPRHIAIQTAIQNLNSGDILVLAGKGHESGQTIQGIEYPFNDITEAKMMLKGLTEHPLWTAEELQMALNTPVDKNIKGFGVTFNSKEIKIGDIFIALTTGKTDGHKYVTDALHRGACACIVNHKMDDVLPHQQIIVPDTLLALHALARFARMRTSAQIVGITGSCGKTTTKEMLTAVLKDQGLTHATMANLNNNLGVPLTMANMPANAQYGVIEMGISHPGEMTELSDFVRPNITIVTNIAPAHQEYFPDTHAIAAEKIHIVDYQDKQGAFVVNTDDAQSQFMADTASSAGIKKIIRFGWGEKSDFKLLSARPTDTDTQVEANWHEEKLNYTLHFVGTHFAINSLGVLAVVDALGASVNQAIETLKSLTPIKGRGQKLDLVLNDKQIHIIDDAYNANPASMKASILAFAAHTGRKIAVLGDMLELGEKSYQMHLDILDLLTQNGISKLYAVGPIMNQVFDLAPPDLQGAKTLSAIDLADTLKADLQDGDWVLFKASHGTGLDPLIKKLKGE